ncbi:MAG: hypothetical protein Q9162_003633 [Coniocarpon cinnabarinum]
MTVTLLSYIKRLPTLSHAEFVAIAENEHMPMMRETFGDALPRMTRYYVDSTQPALHGSAPDHDCVVRMEFEDEAALQKMYAKQMEPEVQTAAMESQKKFLVLEATKTVKVNEFKA